MAIRAYLVLRNIVLVCISRRTIWLESSSSTQSNKLFSDYMRLWLQSTYPFKIRAFPPGFQWKSRYQIWTSKLPWMVYLWHFSTIQSHKDPFANALYTFILRIANFVLDKLLAGQSLKSWQVVFLKDGVNLHPHCRCSWVLRFLLFLTAVLSIFVPWLCLSIWNKCLFRLSSCHRLLFFECPTLRNLLNHLRISFHELCLEN